MSDQQYSLLRNWYLAHLRKGALENEARLEMTPAALMKADRELLMQMVERSSADSGSARVAPTAGIVWQLVPWVLGWLTGLLAFYVWLAMFHGGELDIAGKTFLGLTIGVLDTASSFPTGLSLLFWSLPAFFFGLPIVAAWSIFGRRLR